MNRILPIAALAALSLMRPYEWLGTPRPLAPERELASLVPEECLVYVEASGLRSLLTQGLEHPFLRHLQTSELGQAWLSTMPSSPVAGLAQADAWLGASSLGTAAELTERGLALGFEPGTEKSVIVARGRDATAVEQGLGRVLDAVERQYGWPGGLDVPTERWSGASVWILGAAVVARRGDLLVLANDRGLVEEVLELAADPEGRGQLARPGFAAQHAARPTDATIWAWLELAELEAHADEGFRELRAANRSPAAQGILGARIASLLSARALSVALHLEGAQRVEVRVRASEAPCVDSLAPLARPGGVPAEIDNRGLAQALLYRDYARYFTQRVEVFGPESLPAFAEAITNGALFFEGQDLGEEVLAHVSPWIRFVSRELEFAPDLRPGIPLPGAAIVALLDREEAGEPWTSAFQSLVSVINLDRAQKGQPSMRLHLVREGDVEISTARFSAPAPADGVDMRYNLEPALAVVGRHLVLGTHASLVRELVRELSGKAPGVPQVVRETLWLDSSGWRSLVEQNFEALVANKMLETGLARPAAAQEIRALQLALAFVEGARVELDGADAGAPELRMELHLARGADDR